ncbi:RNA polymerase factor sigma-54 [Sanyastnella coralliicola]|uniref:RNA polymerase factor sigma-54 n=1 Tax=Sanyastnella coralliicola TaxID=3069118 RepID=UPI0027B9C0DF|nr:RNA polymerase factor sigma-54 [Longitalea sp. SCSIO 12813]
MLKQTLQQKLLQKLSPQQIQLMKLLQVPTVELEQRIKEELEANPALDEGREDVVEDSYEEDYGDERSEAQEDFDMSDYLDDDTPDYKYSTGGRGEEDEKNMPLGSGRTFHDNLRSQLSLLSLDEDQRVIAENLIGNIDDSGYLRRELRSIVNDMAFSQNIQVTEEELEAVLKSIHELDPPGVGARDLQECLLIQLRRKRGDSYDVEIGIRILEEHFEEFTKKHYNKIIKAFDIDEDVLKDAIAEIVRLNPKPGNSSKQSARAVQHIVPDFLVSVEDDELKLQLNQRNAPELRISPQYRDMLQSYQAATKSDKKQKDAVMFVKQKIDSAKWFIDAIRQRQQTLTVVMQAILTFQEEYFLTGDETKLKPMILKDIAEVVHMDISTVSRVANSKYVQCPYGTFLLKSFFSESIAKDSGEEVSTREVKKILQEAIDAEDKKKPLTDDKLAKLLKEKGYNIARRTVAKYREQLNIPVARLRKQL